MDTAVHGSIEYDHQFHGIAVDVASRNQKPLSSRAAVELDTQYPSPPQHSTKVRQRETETPLAPAPVRVPRQSDAITRKFTKEIITPVPQ